MRRRPPPAGTRRRAVDGLAWPLRDPSHCPDGIDRCQRSLVVMGGRPCCLVPSNAISAGLLTLPGTTALWPSSCSEAIVPPASRLQAWIVRSRGAVLRRQLCCNATLSRCDWQERACHRSPLRHLAGDRALNAAPFSRSMGHTPLLMVVQDRHPLPMSRANDARIEWHSLQTPERSGRRKHRHENACSCSRGGAHSCVGHASKCREAILKIPRWPVVPQAIRSRA